MKPMFLSFIVGLLVGVLYGLIRVKSPAPPIIALLGLLGMVIGEQCGTWVVAKKVSLVHAASVSPRRKALGSATECRAVRYQHPTCLG